LRPPALIFIFLFLAILNFDGIAQSAKAEYDTLNVLDFQGQRQGFWKLSGDMTGEAGYKKNQLVEEGSYIDNKREGIWKKYYPTGTIKSEINYQNNHPKGFYRIHYRNGKVEEEGTWMTNKNTGLFLRFHENGNRAQEFEFNDNGKRNGLQKYYHENGQLHMTVELENGVASGTQKTYYTDGSLMEEKRLTNGEVEAQSKRTYPPKAGATTGTKTPLLPNHETKPAAQDRPNIGEFKFNGFNALYNKNLQITQVGEFKEGRLYNGKWHRYDDNGLLKKVEVYRYGRFIGYAEIEESN
jgi:antitoxin component YwqK of YwqJK toxin-antitoxin module